MLAKKTSYFWSALLGLLSPALQMAIYYVRFGRLNSIAGFLDFSWFFLSGLVGGILFLTFIRSSPNSLTRQLVFVAYVLAYPASLAGMILGGLFGPIGVVLLPLIPWTLIMFVGYTIGRRYGTKQT